MLEIASVTNRLCRNICYCSGSRSQIILESFFGFQKLEPMLSCLWRIWKVYLEGGGPDMGRITSVGS